MRSLAVGKRRVGEKLGNRVLQAEGRVTLVDAYVAAAVAAVLLGLVLNAAMG